MSPPLNLVEEAKSLLDSAWVNIFNSEWPWGGDYGPTRQMVKGDEDSDVDFFILCLFLANIQVQTILVNFVTVIVYF